MKYLLYVKRLKSFIASKRLKNMLLSKLSFNNYIEIINEKEFYTLGLVSQTIGKKYLTFINEKKYFPELTEDVSVVITKKELIPYIKRDICIVISDNPALTFFELHNFLSNDANYSREMNKTKIGNNCSISKNASIADENVIIGNNVVIEDFVTIYPNVVINDNTIIRSGARIGGYGFQCKRTPEGSVLDVLHLGGVIIGKNVDIHCNSCIDRALYPWDNTIIGDYARISSLVHIGHGVKIRERTFIAGSTCIGGRTEIGKDSWLGMGTIIKNALHIGNNANITMGAVLAENVENGKEMSGFYAIDHKTFLFNQLRMRNI